MTAAGTDCRYLLVPGPGEIDLAAARRAMRVARLFLQLAGPVSPPCDARQLVIHCLEGLVDVGPDPAVCVAGR